MSEYIYATGGETVQNMTSDVFEPCEEIVRCKDCVHSIKADLSGNWYECMKPDGNGDYARWDVETDGFCAWGERRTNDN